MSSTSTMPFTVCAITAYLSQSLFTGKERDAETGFANGNDYFTARYYGSSMGRFMSPDPSGLYYADQINPQSLNFYSYSYNNPLINIDPSGMDACVYDEGNNTSYIVNAADGGAVACSENGAYITCASPKCYPGRSRRTCNSYECV